MSTCIIKDIAGIKKSWCGEIITSMSVHFSSIDHFVIARSDESMWGHPVCKDCLLEIYDIVDDELGI